MSWGAAWLTLATILFIGNGLASALFEWLTGGAA